MSSVIGPVRGKYYLDYNAEIIRNREEILAGEGRVSHEKTFEDEKGRHIIRSYHIPLRPDRDYPPGCLMILDDISELVEQRERRSLIMNQLVSTLLTVVGRRDPFTADHALRVSDVAECIAKEMELEDQVQVPSGTYRQRLHVVVVSGNRADDEHNGFFPRLTLFLSSVPELPTIGLDAVGQVYGARPVDRHRGIGVLWA